ncbi:hypothetical protein predicted by Glimmer/Critica [Bdellovibrio bacteriovorus HD100]|uniref:Uncharacterized protein n=1 Tax=Bdellovibrio bacteriovorus (strain ATCC 15356 / DSM 50701 / NCIMB 9529 / HD100) TaxID=264462 RepID=Q6MQR1_BDEBA|nr:hypothetical protein predicted by Glimmer/Critica [Bdellovibrio bacteriovorus HD100]
MPTKNYTQRFSMIFAKTKNKEPFKKVQPQGNAVGWAFFNGSGLFV